MPATLIPDLEREEAELVLPSFDPATAWELGSRIMPRAFSLTVEIRRPTGVVLRSTAAGCTPDQGIWLEKKSALALRMEASSALVAARIAANGIDPVGDRLARPGDICTRRWRVPNLCRRRRSCGRGDLRWALLGGGP